MKKQICVSLFALLFVCAMPLGAMELRDAAEQRNRKSGVVTFTGNNRYYMAAGIVTSSVVGLITAVVLCVNSQLVPANCALFGAAMGAGTGARLGIHFLADDEEKTAEKQS